MIPPADAPRFRDYLQILSRWWGVLLAATALSAGVGWLSWVTATPIYDSSTRVLVKATGDATALDALYGQINAESRALTYQYLVRSARVTGPTIDQLDLAETTEGLAGRISIPPSLTPVLEIVVKGVDPDETRRVATAVTANMIAVSRDLAKVDGSMTELVLVDDAGPAVREGSMMQQIVKASVLGLVTSLVLVLAVGLLRDRLLGRGQLVRVVDGGGRPD